MKAVNQRPASTHLQGHSIAILLASLLSLPWISAGQQGTGSIDGVVKGEQGTPIAGATILYGRLAITNAKASGAMFPPVLAVTTDAKGGFSVANLAAATYLFCVQAPLGTYLDPCHWSKTPPTFAVAAGQAIHGATINVVSGQQVPITITDPLSSFAKEASTPDAHLTLGVVGPSGLTSYGSSI
jgi:hypothetical protein